MRCIGHRWSVLPLNSYTTSETIYQGYVPVSRRSSPQRSGGIFPFEVHIRLRPADARFRFAPAEVTLKVAGVLVPLAGAGTHVVRMPGRDAPKTSTVPPFTAPLSRDETFALDDPSRDKIYEYCLTFDIESPDPATEFTLDLSRAVVHPGYPAFPRWSS